MRLVILFAGLALFLIQPPSVAFSAGQCSAKFYREAHSAMTKRLLATGYSKAQVGFLMGNTDRITSALRSDRLNDNGRACGIDSARAHVLGCLDKQLFPLKRGSSASLDEEPKDFGAGNVWPYANCSLSANFMAVWAPRKSISFAADPDGVQPQ